MLKISLLFILIFVSQNVYALELENITVIKENNKGVEGLAAYLEDLKAAIQQEQKKAQEEGRQFKAEEVDIDNTKLQKAFAHVLKALAEKPNNLAARINLGLIFEFLKQPEKAKKEYSYVAKAAQDPVLRFSALFNLGRAHALTQNIPLALENYQKALEIDPDSEEVKNNIEVLWLGQGQGKGEGDKDKSGKDGDQGGENQDQGNNDRDPNKPIQNGKKQPKKYKGPLTKNDVRKILEEIKDQEQKIRAKEFSKGSKQAPRDKDW